MKKNRSTLLAIHRESLASARSQKTTTSLIFLIIAGMCMAVFLTSGRTAATEEAVLSRINDQTTRTIILRATGEESGLDARLLAPLNRLGGVEAVIGFGPTEDVTNAAIPGGNLVAARALYTAVPIAGLPASTSPLTDTVAVSEQASYELGLAGLVHGSVQDDAGTTRSVTSAIETPSYLDFLEPLVLIPTELNETAPLATVVIVTKSSPLVEVIAGVARDLAAPPNPQHLTIETAEQLGAIRQAISGDLGTFGRSTVLGILGVTAALVAINLYGLVLLRRKDFGRRRALGATRGTVISLLLWQVTVVSTTGALVGTVASMAILRLEDHVRPDLSFMVSVAVLAVATAVTAAIPPALFAASRDPLRELRVP